MCGLLTAQRTWHSRPLQSPSCSPWCGAGSVQSGAPSGEFLQKHWADLLWKHHLPPGCFVPIRTNAFCPWDPCPVYFPPTHAPIGAGHRTVNWTSPGPARGWGKRPGVHIVLVISFFPTGWLAIKIRKCRWLKASSNCICFLIFVYWLI